MEATPDTVNYLIAGYACLLGIPLLYLASGWLRRRNLEKDLDVIRSLADKPDQPK